MKKILLILIGFITTISLFGQNEEKKTFRRNHLHQNKHNLNEQQAFRRAVQRTGIHPILQKSVYSEPQRLDSLVEYKWNGSVWIIIYK